MKLIELEPQWLILDQVFVFRCPHCRKDLLSCKSVVMSSQAQLNLFEKHFGSEWNMLIVPCKEDQAWTFKGSDFTTLSVTPSLDASASGHWHGFITNGEIR